MISSPLCHANEAGSVTPSPNCESPLTRATVLSPGSSVYSASVSRPTKYMRLAGSEGRRL